ncbi:MAG: histidine phosphotransferase family protein [Alphaproteobacteria bacterium]|nr:histidine phosphotransferase family protein [Alphaproteobacteria bacterium]
MQIDMRIMELLASKLCHDLVSPVSAINNGVELIEDIGGSVVEEAMKLIGDSGAKAARRLKMYRLAYGRAGSEENLGLKDVRQVASQYLSDTKITIVWPDDLPDPALGSNRGFLKVILNLIILAEEVLAYGGVITLSNIRPSDENKGGCRVEAVGRNASLNKAMQGAVEATVSIEELSARTIQAYVTGRFAEHFRYKLSFDQSIPDRLDLSLSLGYVAVEVDLEAKTEQEIVSESVSEISL